MADEPENDAENDPDSGGDPASGPDSGDDAGADAGASNQDDDSAEGEDGEEGATSDSTDSDPTDSDPTDSDPTDSDPTDSDPTEDVGSEDENGASNANADEDSASEDGGADEDSGDSGSDDSRSADDDAADDDAAADAAADDSDAGEGGDGDAHDDEADGSAGVASDDGTHPDDDAMPPEGSPSTEAPEDGGATQVARTSPDQDHSNALVVNMWLRLRFRDPEDKPRVGLPYKLTINGQTIEDKTNNEGILIRRVAFGQEDGTLEIDGQQIILKLYQLPPIDQISGVQARLSNLHYYRGEIDNQLSLDTQEAIRRFQDDMTSQGISLPVTGDLDEATTAALLQQHGS